jgi:hypothetical protein
MKFLDDLDKGLDALYNIKGLAILAFSSNFTLMIAAGYNPMYAICGTAGQLMYLGGKYVQSFNTKQ